MRRFLILATVVPLVSLGAFSCQSPNLEPDAAPILLRGYSDFRGASDADVGYVLYSYQTPLALKPEQVIPAAVDQLTTLRPCYKTVEHSTFSALLRCEHPDRSKRFNFTQEYAYRMVPQKRRLYMMGIIDVPSDVHRHEELLHALEDVAAQQN